MTDIQIEALVLKYLAFKRCVIAEGYADELDWQDRLCLRRLTESEILKEFAWVVLSSGMNYKVISRLFNNFSDAFYQWQSAELIERNKKSCTKKAMKVFANEKKLNAIVHFCGVVADIGVQELKDRIVDRGINYIQAFPYMGSATAYHFAKNIGVDVVKPDRHLVRISQKLGFDTPHQMCSLVSTATADKLSVVDLVYWRYAVIDKLYLNKLQPAFT